MEIRAIQSRSEPLTDRAQSSTFMATFLLGAIGECADDLKRCSCQRCNSRCVPEILRYARDSLGNWFWIEMGNFRQSQSLWRRHRRKCAQIKAGGSIIILEQGELQGNGEVLGNVSNSVLVAPSGSPGRLTINGNYVANFRPANCKLN